MTNLKNTDILNTTSGAWTKDRRANLTKQIAYLSLGVCVFYIVFDYISGADEYIPFYLILFVGSGLCLWLLSRGIHTLAKVSLLVSGMVLLTIFSAWETRETGIFMYFLVLALGAITLFGPEEKWVAFVIGVTTFLLFYVIYFTEWIAIERITLTEEYISTSLLINYAICLIATMTMVYYILSIGQRYEAEAKRTENELYEKNLMLTKTNEELDRFVYSTSHDLKAPLSSMLGLINIAELTDDSEERKKCLALMQSRVETLNGFIADIISYSRNTRLEVIKEEVVLKEIISTIFQNLEHYSNCDKIRLDLDFDVTLKFKTDKSRLRVIFNNLLSNAIKYHNIDQEDPFIKITAIINQGNLVVDFKDNGQGIADENISDIFNMFYRASEDSDGSGLGLYIAREMTEKLKGHLSVTSQKGVGTTFRLMLPKI